MWKFQGSIEKEVKFPGVFKKKIMWNFHGSLLSTLEFASVVRQFCRISRGKNLLPLEFLWVKLQI